MGGSRWKQFVTKCTWVKVDQENKKDEGGERRIHLPHCLQILNELGWGFLWELKFG